jgi:hypothetical protein
MEAIAIAAQEQAEFESGRHESALKAGTETDLPFSHEARKILRAMERGWMK